ncbi:hypothetical protein [Microvirga brassicacearum]|uniref:Uncharacterized protein n=1 Tax=Microvirga brassicacearum TaxID=2580413 RepID=A0A5N3PH43_9HYPH|nr:hypothetical protein [Microvirga brassicacearum]KAB0269047.1 hypothetical protein FEZ63_02765 [Microvirga brassicacearum]
MTSKLQSACELAAIFAQEAANGHCPKGRNNPAPHLIAADVIALLRIGGGVARRAVQHCNGIPRYEGKPGQLVATWHQEDEDRKERLDARDLAKASEIAARYGAKAQIGGDPRGYTLRLFLASGRNNTFGGAESGWGVA